MGSRQNVGEVFRGQQARDPLDKVLVIIVHGILDFRKPRGGLGEGSCLSLGELLLIYDIHFALFLKSHSLLILFSNTWLL